MMLIIAPGLDVDLQFSRAQAEDAVRQFQKRDFSDLNTERFATVLIRDRGLQNYMELEAGGIGAYQQIIPQLGAVTQYWKVPTFSPG